MSTLANRIKALSGVSQQDKYELKGELIEMDKDSIVLKIGTSLFDIPKESIKDQKGGDEIGKEITIEIENNAQILQSVLKPVSVIVSNMFANFHSDSMTNRDDYDCSVCSDCGDYDCSVCSDCDDYDCSVCLNGNDPRGMSRLFRSKFRDKILIRGVSKNLRKRR